MKLTEKYQRDPVLVRIARKELTTDLTEQYYIEVREPSKIELLCRLIDVNAVTLGLVFCNTKKRVDQVTGKAAEQRICSRCSSWRHEAARTGEGDE